MKSTSSKDQLQNLIALIHFIENVSTKIHNIEDKGEIFRILKNEFLKYKHYRMSILILTDNGTKLKIAVTSLSEKYKKMGEKISGLKTDTHKIDLKKTTIYRRVIEEKKTLHTSISDIINELFPQPVAYLIIKMLGYKKRLIISTPLIQRGNAIGILAISPTTIFDNYIIPTIENFALHISNALELADEHIKRKKAEEELIYRSHHDELTGLYNRFFLEESMQRLDTNRQLPFSVIMGDINGLKLVNDGFGHNKGDALIKKMALVFRNVCRSEDIIGRWGGDEFLILLPKTNEQTAMQVCSRIREACSASTGTAIPLSIALGEGTKTKSNQGLQEIIIKAETRMYANKLLNEKSIRSALLSSLQMTLSEKSYETRRHTQRLRELAVLLGHYLGLVDNEMDSLELLAVLHDIGKVAIPEHILAKSGALSFEEKQEIKKHPEIGYRIIKLLPELASIADGVRAHHEWWNGKGYPHGLKKEEIPLISRIIAVVDAYEVMVYGKRPYKKEITTEQALEELKKCAGTQFEPKIVKVFSNMVKNYKVKLNPL